MIKFQLDDFNAAAKIIQKIAPNVKYYMIGNGSEMKIVSRSEFFYVEATVPCEGEFRLSPWKISCDVFEGLSGKVTLEPKDKTIEVSGVLNATFQHSLDEVFPEGPERPTEWIGLFSEVKDILSSLKGEKDADYKTVMIIGGNFVTSGTDRTSVYHSQRRIGDVGIMPEALRFTSYPAQIGMGKGVSGYDEIFFDCGWYWFSTVTKVPEKLELVREVLPNINNTQKYFRVQKELFQTILKVHKFSEINMGILKLKDGMIEFFAQGDKFGKGSLPAIAAKEYGEDFEVSISGLELEHMLKSPEVDLTICEFNDLLLLRIREELVDHYLMVR